MTRKYRRGDPLEVRWNDHCGQSGWRSDAEADCGLLEIRSVGFFLKRDRRTLTIAQSLDDLTPSKTNDRLSIGVGQVRRIKRLR